MSSSCGRHLPLAGLSRRELLRQAGNGFGALALAALLADEARADDRRPTTDHRRIASSVVGGRSSVVGPLPHFPPRAKRVIFLFMSGGPSHVDLFDPKPRLRAENGKPLPFPMPALMR